MCQHNGTSSSVPYAVCRVPRISHASRARRFTIRIMHSISKVRRRAGSRPSAIRAPQAISVDHRNGHRPSTHVPRLCVDRNQDDCARSLAHSLGRSVVRPAYFLAARMKRRRPRGLCDGASERKDVLNFTPADSDTLRTMRTRAHTLVAEVAAVAAA